MIRRPETDPPVSARVIDSKHPRYTNMVVRGKVLEHTQEQTDGACVGLRRLAFVWKRVRTNRGKTVAENKVREDAHRPAQMTEIGSFVGPWRGRPAGKGASAR